MKRLFPYLLLTASSVTAMAACNLSSGSGGTSTPVTDTPEDDDDDEPPIPDASFDGPGFPDVTTGGNEGGLSTLPIVHPMSWVQIPAVAGDVVTLTEGGTTWQLDLVVSGGATAVNIPLFDPGSGATGVLAKNGAAFATVNITPTTTSVPPGQNLIDLLELMRQTTTQDAPRLSSDAGGGLGASDAGDGGDGGTSQRPDLDQLESLIVAARTAPVVLGTFGGASVVLDSAALARFDRAELALRAAPIVLTASGQPKRFVPLDLAGLSGGPLSVISDSTAYVMRGAEDVAEVPESQRTQPDGWMATMIAFAGEHTPGPNGSYLGASIVFLLGKTQAQAVASSLLTWAADHAPANDEPAPVDTMPGADDFSTTVQNAPDDPPGACDPGMTVCSGSCTDVSSDTLNCGSCGNVCYDPESCLSGVCSQGAVADASVPH